MSADKPPLITKCLNCGKKVVVKYVRASRDYSQKNHWGYWTEAKENDGCYTCDQCLFRLYKNYRWEFCQLIPNKKKRVLLRQYIVNGDIKGKIEPAFSKLRIKTIKKE
ncbi:hypothetical protein [endosymbiont DhMRE of Dentiscutata heterogama]|uniref:hypothetical protein n=1 Tax=endosymbiont DhMRE of Dentiscutata heterogama TaxID=1609546 RepID=UPI002AD53955|nr:hypothetical protein [endosymbiont DhMRE of Dentiscutata heterogama]